ncbi:MAG: hypothetical protein PHW41_08150, partial [Eubacteriales bacterium]|nr:hypothetical protein [Eubacteriales bacterium]
MTEQAGRHKSNHKSTNESSKKSNNSMRNAAVIALVGVIGVCVLFLLVVLPLRALQEHRKIEATVSPVPTP